MKLNFIFYLLWLGLIFLACHPKNEQVHLTWTVDESLNLTDSLFFIEITDSVAVYKMGVTRHRAILAKVPISDGKVDFFLSNHSGHRVHNMYYADDAVTLNNNLYLKAGTDLNFVLRNDTMRDRGKVMLNPNYSGDWADLNEYYKRFSRQVVNYINLIGMSVNYDSLSWSEVTTRHQGRIDITTRLLEDLPPKEEYASFVEIEKKREQYVFIGNQYYAVDENYDDFSKYMDGQDEEKFPVSTEDYDMYSDDINILNLAQSIVRYRAKYTPLAPRENRAIYLFNEIAKIPDGGLKDALMLIYFSERHFPSAGLYSRAIYDNIHAIARSNITDDAKLRTFDELAKAREPIASLLGAPAPEFSLLDHKGKQVTSDDLKGSYVYIDVWASWCGPCVREVPYLLSLKKDYSHENIEFIGISTDKNEKAWKKGIDRLSLSGVQLIVDKHFNDVLNDVYGVSAIPHFILLSPEGNIVVPDAPRPSDPAIRTLFDNLLEKI